MSDKHENATAYASAKARLLKEGELHRLMVMQSKHQVAHALHPEVLLHGAVDMGIAAVQARFAGLLAAKLPGIGGGSGSGGGGGGLSGILGGINYKALMPVAITVASFIQKRRLTKPALALGTVAAAAAGWYYRRKQKHPH
ncbi:hypothetical protein [Pseudoduganella buxea]|uniref:Uncharacterized protein n=1 Tax=Pseudoduganella buxea TaxID=1949069 RepID=A0A6I3SYW3_9BURK|nr:hypothetical protein [Pseudoduganella buxea]MTV53825.1 hypothetical protein [Pseudoduganella buxea]GGC01065.1 hypothetical protein GCM10011572_23840 [Pseudoduganella buxea]